MRITETEYLFVYGTLMQQYKDNPYTAIVKKYAQFLATAFTTGELYLIENYPGLVKTDTFEFVYGEIYTVQDSKNIFQILDKYEDYDVNDTTNSLYQRKQIQVFTDVNEPPKTAWTYLYNKPTELLRKIEGGNFIDFLSGNINI